MMYQSQLFTEPKRIVNVASVPQRSPFRYAGGKTWLVPRIRQWLDPYVRQRVDMTPSRIAEFIEPFAGGGIVSLTVAAEHLAEHVTMVELDEDVAAVWQMALDSQGSDAFFIDPPYTVHGNGKRAGRRLYRYNEINHERLFALSATIQGDCLLTYDVASEVQDLAVRHHLAFRPVAMKNTHHATMGEYVIGRSMAWLD